MKADLFFEIFSTGPPNTKQANKTAQVAEALVGLLHKETKM